MATDSVESPMPPGATKGAPKSALFGRPLENISSWLNILGFIVGIIGVALGWYFYEASKIKPLLTFAVHPLKTELQRPDQDRELGFTYGGKPIDSESITSVQMSIWNAGTRSIRDGDVLEPLRLVMPEGSPILRARVKKTSRPICGFECLDTPEDCRLGTCRVRWKILEPGDGAVIQIIYAGSARNDPRLEGVVEGQSEGIVVNKYTLDSDRTSIARGTNIWSVRLALVALLLCLSGLFMATAYGRMMLRFHINNQLTASESAAKMSLDELRKKAARLTRRKEGLLWLASLLSLGAAALALITGVSRGPPFGW